MRDVPLTPRGPAGLALQVTQQARSNATGDNTDPQASAPVDSCVVGPESFGRRSTAQTSAWGVVETVAEGDRLVFWLARSVGLDLRIVTNMIGVRQPPARR